MTRAACAGCSHVFDVSLRSACPACGRPVAPGRRGRPLRPWILAGLALLLLGTGAAVLFTRDVPGPGGEEVPLGGDVTEAQMRAAHEGFRARLENPQGADPWGAEGWADLQGAPYQMRFLWDPAAQAYEFAYRSNHTDVESVRRQRGAVINYHDGEEVFVGRDERPQTYAQVERNVLTQRPWSLEDYEVEAIEPSNVRGRVATHFVGRNATGPMHVWVYDHGLRLAGLRGQLPGVSFDLRFFYDDVQVHVAEEGPRASVRMEIAETLELSSAQPHTVWVNGTLSSNHTEEVKLAELEMRATQGPKGAGAPLAIMHVLEGHAMRGGYEFQFEDEDADGLLSPGDRYQFIVHPGERFASLSFFDLWAQSYEGGRASGFALWILLLAAGAATIVRRGYSWISS